MRKILFVLISVIAVVDSNAQLVSIGYFPFNNTISITSNPEKLFWVDTRIETNTFYGNSNPEVFGMINLKRSDSISFYTGLSCRLVALDGFEDGNYIGGYSISIGTRFKPFEKWRNLHFMVELSPYINKDFSSGILRSYIGVSYTLKKRKKNSASKKLQAKESN